MGDKHAQESRYWLLTFNNPQDHGVSLDSIESAFTNGPMTRYWCMSEEIGLEEHTPHIHAFVYYVSARPFKTMKNQFPSAHIDFPNGTPEQNRDYVFKQGKWENDEKTKTNIKESHRESGECPVLRPGSRNDLSGLYDMIKEGLSNYEILEKDPSLIKYLDTFDRIRKTVLEEKFKNTWRNLEVTYIFGGTGTGKTRSVKDKYGYSNVYTVNDYSHPFDSYAGQDVLLFEEFRGNIRISDMLQFLDGYPLDLPCRYSNKVACFTKVYFCTNIDLNSQYENVQREEPETWKAFLRRIHNVEYRIQDKIFKLSCNDYQEGKLIEMVNPFREH